MMNLNDETSEFCGPMNVCGLSFVIIGEPNIIEVAICRNLKLLLPFKPFKLYYIEVIMCLK